MREGAAFGRPLPHFYDNVDSSARIFVELWVSPLSAYTQRDSIIPHGTGLHTPPTVPWTHKSFGGFFLTGALGPARGFLPTGAPPPAKLLHTPRLKTVL